MSRRRRGGIALDITPLIDVLFMLIIFFVLTATFLSGQIVVDLPQGEGIREGTGGSQLLTVTPEGGLLWGNREIEREELPDLVQSALDGKGQILVAADRSAPYGDVAEVLDLLRRLGVSSAGLALEGGEAP